MTLGNRLRDARKRAKYTQKELGMRIGAKHNSVSNWEKGLNMPNPEIIELICKELDITPNFLLMGDEFGSVSVSEEMISPYEIAVIKKYRGLDKNSRGAINALLDYYNGLSAASNERVIGAPAVFTADMKHQSHIENRQELKAATFEVIQGLVSTQRVAAGTGAYLDSDSFDSISVKKNHLTRKAAFYVPVSGNSMEPKFHDGDILIIEKAPVKYSEIGIFTLNGQGFVKIRGKSELISINPDYEPIPMNDDIICNGKVIGVLEPEWIAD